MLILCIAVPFDPSLLEWLPVLAWANGDFEGAPRPEFFMPLEPLDGCAPAVECSAGRAPGNVDARPKGFASVEVIFLPVAAPIALDVDASRQTPPGWLPVPNVPFPAVQLELLPGMTACAEVELELVEFVPACHELDADVPPPQDSCARFAGTTRNPAAAATAIANTIRGLGQLMY